MEIAKENTANDCGPGAGYGALWAEAMSRGEDRRAPGPDGQDGPGCGGVIRFPSALIAADNGSTDKKRIRPHLEGKVTCRIMSVPTSRIYLLNGVELSYCLPIFSGNPGGADISKETVLLKTGKNVYRIIRPSNGALRLEPDTLPRSVRATVYEIAGSSEETLLRTVSRCIDKRTHYLDVADAFMSLIENEGLTQKDLSGWFGISQSSISNKLRLCCLGPSVRSELRDSDLGERHCRALLNVDTEEMQIYVLKLVSQNGISAQRAENLIKTLHGKKVAETGRQEYFELIDNAFKSIISVLNREKRQFITTLQRDVDHLRKVGIPVMFFKKDFAGYFELVIRIPKGVVPAASQTSYPQAAPEKSA